MSEKFGANFTTDNVINQYKSFKTIHSNIVGCLSISDAQRDAVQNNHIRYYLHFMNWGIINLNCVIYQYSIR